MFILPTGKKFGVLLAAGLCLYEYSLPFKLGSCVVCIPLCFVLSEYRNIFKIVKSYQKTVLGITFMIGILSIVEAVIASPSIRYGLSSFILYVLGQITGRYVLLFAALTSINSKESIVSTYKITYIACFVMFLFGLSNLIMHHSLYVDWLYDGQKVVDYLEDAGAMYADRERFRVQGTFHNPFDYGYSCIAMLLFFWYGYLKSYVRKSTFILAVLFSLFGILTCNCRTVYFVFVMSVIGFAYMYFPVGLMLRRLGYVIIVMVLSVMFIPQVNEKYELMMSMFSQNSQTEGSSLEMRSIQFLSVLGYLEGHELLGNGVGYFSSELGFSEGKTGRVDITLAGMEGSYLMSLLETGYLGTILYFGLILYVLLWAWKKRKVDRSSSAFLFVLYFSFLIFGIMTGELRSAYITFLLGGFAISEYYKNINYLRV